MCLPVYYHIFSNIIHLGHMEDGDKLCTGSVFQTFVSLILSEKASFPSNGVICLKPHSPVLLQQASARFSDDRTSCTSEKG